MYKRQGVKLALQNNFPEWGEEKKGEEDKTTVVQVEICLLYTSEQYRALSIEHSSLSPIIEKFAVYKKAAAAHAEAKELLHEGGMDPEFKEMASEQLEESAAQMESLEKELRVLLLPKDPNDDKNVIMEIRGGAGGEEAALFANSLYRMYTMYAESRRWKIEVLNLNATELGGIKEISFSITGPVSYTHLDVYKRQRFLYPCIQAGIMKWYRKCLSAAHSARFETGRKRI